MFFDKMKSIDSKKISLITILNIVIFYVLYRVAIFIANNTRFYEWFLISDIVSITLVVGLISIFSFFLYSSVYDDDYFHMFSLMYISIYFEFVMMTLLARSLNVFGLMEVNKIFVGFASIFRTIIIWLTYYEQNPINRYLHNNKIYAVFLSIIITFMCIMTDLYLMTCNVLNSHMPLINWIKVSVNIATFIILIRFSIQYVNKKNVNYFITFLGTDIMFFSRVLLMSNLYPDKYTMYVLNRIILCCGFAIIVISMFWEVIMMTKENKKLINDFNTQKLEILRLKHEEELRTQFFANISHELRTPLNIMICSFQLLESKSKDKDSLSQYYKKYEKVISENSSRMLRLINNIIDASKFEAGCFKMDFANCEIIRVIEDITLSIAQSEKSQKRNIIFDTNTEFLEIKCDPENIERVMLNLLSNAIKFTDNDGEIIVSCEENEDYLVIRVKDNGIGIPPEFRSRIFERFVQVDKSFRRNVEGSGIGLSIVKFIVDSHEGEIYINDEVIKGCEFVIKIPNVKIENDIVVNNYNKELKKEINAKVNIELSDIQ